MNASPSPQPAINVVIQNFLDSESSGMFAGMHLGHGHFLANTDVTFVHESHT
jgi:hypothetical protein